MTRRELTIKEADTADLTTVTALINRAYRGDSSRLGWTTEADLLGGLRIDEKGMETLLHDPNTLLLIALEAGEIVASIHARREKEGAHFGLFAVEPTLQGRGIGTELLESAESAVQKRWSVEAALMEVISLRDELIAFYGRHGYHKTGKTVPFPRSPLWEPRVEKLEMCVLKKELG